MVALGRGKKLLPLSPSFISIYHKTHTETHREMALSLSNSFLQINVPPAAVSMRKVVTNCVVPNQPKWTCRKKDIHPEYHDDAKVYCSGELVLTTGGTKKEYVVDVWSGNHPFYLGSRSANMVDADQVEKFRKKFSGLPTEMMEIPVLKGEIIIPPKRKSGTGKGGKKK